MIDGYAEVLPDRVIVLAEISEKAEEIDVQRSRAAQERAQAELAKAGVGSEEWQRAQSGAGRAPWCACRPRRETGRNAAGG